jgi:hypothetical protein
MELVDFTHAGVAQLVEHQPSKLLPPTSYETFQPPIEWLRNVVLRRSTLIRTHDTGHTTFFARAALPEGLKK